MNAKDLLEKTEEVKRCIKEAHVIEMSRPAMMQWPKNICIK
jgi:hypothetical protein